MHFCGQHSFTHFPFLYQPPSPSLPCLYYTLTPLASASARRHCSLYLAMALQISISAPSLRMPSFPAASLKQAMLPLQEQQCHRKLGTQKVSMTARRRSGVMIRASLEVAATAVVGQVTEVNKDTFWPIVEAAGEKVVVLDMYTQWCGPCKVIAPKFKQLSEKHLDVVFLKLDCNQENKPLAKELGIKVVPTFKIVKDGKVVTEVTGAKLDDLVLAIETAKTS